MVTGKLILALALVVASLFAQAPSISSPPGGLPISSLPDPVNAPGVTAVCGAPDACTTTYVVSTFACLPQGCTNPSPATTITNGAAIIYPPGSEGPFSNVITFDPILTPNATCNFLVTTGPGAPYTGLPGDCTMGMMTDPGFQTTQQFAAAATSPGGNTTRGVSVPGFTGFGFNGIRFYGSTANNNGNAFGLFCVGGAGINAFSDFLGNPFSYMGCDALGGVWFGSASSGFVAGGSGKGYLGMGSFWTPVFTVSVAGPTAISSDQGITKCDTGSNDVALTLPPVAGFPTYVQTNTSFGITLRVHKPKSANSCTISTTDGTTFGSYGSSIVLGGQDSEIQVYWDGNNDGNAGIWAVDYLNDGVTGTQVITTGCTVMGGVPTGCTSTTNTYVLGRLVSHTP